MFNLINHIYTLNYIYIYLYLIKENALVIVNAHVVDVNANKLDFLMIRNHNQVQNIKKIINKKIDYRMLLLIKININTREIINT